MKDKKVTLGSASTRDADNGSSKVNRITYSKNEYYVFSSTAQCGISTYLFTLCLIRSIIWRIVLRSGLSKDSAMALVVKYEQRNGSEFLKRAQATLSELGKADLDES